MNNVRRLIGSIALAATSLALVATANAQVAAASGWARATTPGAKVAAAYLTLTNSGAQSRKLLKITSTVSDAVSIHQTSITAQGTARMWPMAVLAVAPGQTLRLEPGGMHVMLGDLKAPLIAGQKVPLTMKFDGGEAEMTILLDVRPLVPAANDQAHLH
jgi:hypothetical protein